MGRPRKIPHAKTTPRKSLVEELKRQLTEEQGVNKQLQAQLDSTVKTLKSHKQQILNAYAENKDLQTQLTQTKKCSEENLETVRNMREDLAIAKAQVEHMGPRSGHGLGCQLCQKPINSVAIDPSLWGIPLYLNDNPSMITWAHGSCVSRRLEILKELKGFIGRVDG